MMKLLKYIYLGFRSNFRRNEDFRFGTFILTTIITFVPLYSYFFYTYNVLNLNDILWRFLLSIVLGVTGWVGSAVLLVFCITLYLKFTEFLMKLVDDGKKEEVRIFEILKGTDDETNTKKV